MAIRIFVCEEDGETFAYTQDYFKQFGLETEASVAGVYGDTGKWHEVVLKPLCAATERDIKRLARVSDPERGFLIDETELPAARAATAVQSWTFADAAGTPVPVSKDGYNTLPLRVAQVLDGLLFAKLYGGLDSHFFGYLSSRQPPSGATVPSP